MHAAVVAVGLRVVHLVEVEQLGAAAGDDGTFSTGSAFSRDALAQALDDAREPLRVDRLQQVVERLDRERLDGVLARAR